MGINRLVALSDLHFGNLKVASNLIEERLEKYFIPYIQEPVFLVIPGDVFDRLISINNINSHYVISFFIKLFDKLEETRSILRISRGTYSHDLQQIKMYEIFLLLP